MGSTTGGIWSVLNACWFWPQIDLYTWLTDKCFKLIPKVQTCRSECPALPRQPCGWLDFFSDLVLCNIDNKTMTTQPTAQTVVNLKARASSLMPNKPQTKALSAGKECCHDLRLVRLQWSAFCYRFMLTTMRTLRASEKSSFRSTSMLPCTYKWTCTTNRVSTRFDVIYN